MKRAWRWLWVTHPTATYRTLVLSAAAWFFYLAVRGLLGPLGLDADRAIYYLCIGFILVVCSTPKIGDVHISGGYSDY